MLINLPDLIKEYGLKIKGVIHVGSHWAEEFSDYIAAGIPSENQVWVEPCTPAFNIMREKLESMGALLFKCALGAKAGTATMFVETVNTGQSNSLLKPKEHLRLHSNITFDDTEEVEIRTLDSLALDMKKYNLLMMDVQGFEKYVLMGAKKALKHIDYIYTEINRGQIYEGATQLEDLDTLLPDFERVKTVWAIPNSHDNWGDAFLIRKPESRYVKCPQCVNNVFIIDESRSIDLKKVAQRKSSSVQYEAKWFFACSRCGWQFPQSGKLPQDKTEHLFHIIIHD